MMNDLYPELACQIFYLVDCPEILARVCKKWYRVLKRHTHMFRSGIYSVIERSDDRLYKYNNPKLGPYAYKMLVKRGSLPFIRRVVPRLDTFIAYSAVKHDRLDLVKMCIKAGVKVPERVNLVRYALANNSVAMLDYLLTSMLVTDTSTLFISALSTPGIKTSTLDWIYTHVFFPENIRSGTNLSSYAVAVLNDQPLEILKWLVAKGCPRPIQSRILPMAVTRGYSTDDIQWLRDHDF